MAGSRFIGPNRREGLVFADFPKCLEEEANVLIKLIKRGLIISPASPLQSEGAVVFDAGAVTARRHAAPHRVTCATSARTRRRARGGIMMTFRVSVSQRISHRKVESRDAALLSIKAERSFSDRDGSQEAKGHFAQMRQNSDLLFQGCQV